MKVKRLNEDVMFPETSCTSEIREQVRAEVIEMLNENLDNLAFVISEKIQGYNPDWCNDEADTTGEYNLSIEVCADAICKQLFYNCSSINEEVENLDEDTLVEGPIGDIFRKTANFFDKDASRVRARNEKAAGAADAKAQRDAQKVLAKDVAPEYKDCVFYFNGKGKPISWDDWRDKYANLRPSDPNYEGMYNAIVTKPNGQIIRRGVEDVEKKGIYLKPGVTDKIADMYKYRKPVEETPDSSNEAEDDELTFDPGIPLPHEQTNTTETSKETSSDDDKKGKQVNLDDYIEYKGKKISVNKLLNVAKKTKYLESVDEESIVEDYDYIYGDEILSGDMGNMPDEELDADIRKLRKIGKILGTTPDNLVCYVDPEFENDPVYIDGVESSIVGKLAVYTVDGIQVVSEIINSNLWLYFESEAAGNHYLDYVKENVNW